jgi:type I restriction enzyme R subunit
MMDSGVPQISHVPFTQEGGLGKVHQVFGVELNRMIEELNGALAA